MYLINDIVKFRDHNDYYRVVDVDDGVMGWDQKPDIRYTIENVTTGKMYSFWVYEEDLEQVPEEVVCS